MSAIRWRKSHETPERDMKAIRVSHSTKIVQDTKLEEPKRRTLLQGACKGYEKRMRVFGDVVSGRRRGSAKSEIGIWI